MVDKPLDKSYTNTPSVIFAEGDVGKTSRLVFSYYLVLLSIQIHSMRGLSEKSRAHLEEALQSDNPLEKDFHIQQVLRDSAVDSSQSEMETE
ncbi:hypothetical protein E2L06_18570 [Haloterrigena sp. H1]|nr:hypothetical protein E2L06_18570 [Haloterrigena sp. H1]